MEEAWAEAPRADLQLQDTTSLCELLTSTLPRVDRLEDGMKQVEDEVREAVENIAPSEWYVQSRDELHKEIRKVMLPVALVNLTSKKKLEVFEPSCLDSNPRAWHTICSWKWVEAASRCQLIFKDEDDPKMDGITPCEKCFSWAM